MVSRMYECEGIMRFIPGQYQLGIMGISLFF